MLARSGDVDAHQGSPPLIDDHTFITECGAFEEESSSAQAGQRRWDTYLEDLDRDLAAGLPDRPLGQFEAGDIRRGARARSRVRGGRAIMVTVLLLSMGLGATVAAFVFHDRFVQTFVR
jgi:hypothetical protein